jgi:hypothetical protein
MTLGERFCVERLDIAPGALDDPDDPALEVLAAFGFAGLRSTPPTASAVPP